MPPIIEVKNLVKRYRKSKINAVDDISFSVGEGEFFALLGPNGAGKTTTISVLTTTLIKTKGKVRLAGFDIEKQAKEVRQRIGVIFQNPSLDKNLTGEENVRFHASLYGLYPFRPLFSLMPRKYKEKVFELAELMNMREQIFQPVDTFSGGMKRKLEIIRGLMHNPRILFLDEPTTGLDPVSRKNVWDYLQNVRQKECTTIFLTTHYLEEAEEADHIGIINNGKMVSFGTPQEIRKDLINEYLLINAEDRNALKKELTILDFRFFDTMPIRVEFDNHKTAQEIIQKIKTPLTLLKIHTPTLEEAYLEIIKSHDNKRN